MPEIKFEAVQDPETGEWVVPLMPDEVENPRVLWAFDSAPRTLLTKLKVAEAVRGMDIVTDERGRYSVESYQAAHDLAFARVHLAGRSYQCGDQVWAGLTEDWIDALPEDVLTVYASRARGVGVLRPAKKPTPDAPPADTGAAA